MKQNNVCHLFGKLHFYMIPREYLFELSKSTENASVSTKCMRKTPLKTHSSKLSATTYRKKKHIKIVYYFHLNVVIVLFSSEDFHLMPPFLQYI